MRPVLASLAEANGPIPGNPGIEHQGRAYAGTRENGGFPNFLIEGRRSLLY
jgi:hypothetical protein